MPETKVCEACDATIGEAEKKCPKCGVDFEELEDTLASVQKAQTILEKRRKALEPKPCAKCGKVHDGDCPPPPKPSSKLRGLGAMLRKKAA